MTVGVIAYIKVREGKGAQFEETFSCQAAQVREHEPGNLLYQLFRSRTEPNEYAVMEIYRDDAALQAHVAGTHLATTRSLMPALREEVRLAVFDAVPELAAHAVKPTDTDSLASSCNDGSSSL
jgi:quinol monooxygenase YgiN